MPKRAIYHRKVDGKWAVIELPDDYEDGDRLAWRGSTDQGFDSRDEARAELLRRGVEDELVLLCEVVGGARPG